MTRAPLQVPIYLCYRPSDGSVEFALLKRSDAGYGGTIQGGDEVPYGLPRCKITVIERTLRPDLAEEFLKDASDFGRCERYHDFQEFLLASPFELPAGLCPWAWANMRHTILAITTGSNMPWMKRTGTAVASCADALRPVIFKIERVE